MTKSNIELEPCPCCKGKGELEHGAAFDMQQALIAAERKLTAYIGVCEGDKELWQVVLPQIDAAISKSQGKDV